MAYSVKLERSVIRTLEKLPRPLRNQIVEDCEALKEDPYPPDSVELRGYKGLRRIRVGQFRIIYTVKKETLLVLVVRVGSRGDVYKHLSR